MAKDSSEEPEKKKKKGHPVRNIVGLAVLAGAAYAANKVLGAKKKAKSAKKKSSSEKS